MATQAQSRKASKGTVQIKNSNQRLQLVFSAAGKRRYLSLGLPDNPVNRKLAMMRASEIEYDLSKGFFDPTLEKYKPQIASPATEANTSNLEAAITLLELWSKYVEYKTPQVSPSTIAKDYTKIESHIKRLPTRQVHDAILIRDHLLKHLTPNAAKRCLTQLSACLDWACRSELVEHNPFKGMAKEIKMPKSQDQEMAIESFSIEERDQIIAAFESNRYYASYAPFVKFLFMTGCRPSEAIALRWNNVADDCQSILFTNAATVSVDGIREKQGLKTQSKRRFPCNALLSELLLSLQEGGVRSDQLVFPSPGGKLIDFHNFSNRAWQRILTQIELPHRKPYSMRHTFITLALEHGLEAKDVAQIVGNSPEMIYRHYASQKRELAVPEF